MVRFPLCVMVIEPANGQSWFKRCTDGKSPSFRSGVIRAVAAARMAGRALEGANSAQKTFKSAFTEAGTFAGRSVDDVAGSLRLGTDEDV